VQSGIGKSHRTPDDYLMSTSTLTRADARVIICALLERSEKRVVAESAINLTCWWVKFALHSQFFFARILENFPNTLSGDRHL
jgi:hypothetical protein